MTGMLPVKKLFTRITPEFFHRRPDISNVFALICNPSGSRIDRVYLTSSFVYLQREPQNSYFQFHCGARWTPFSLNHMSMVLKEIKLLSCTELREILRRDDNIRDLDQITLPTYVPCIYYRINRE